MFMEKKKKTRLCCDETCWRVDKDGDETCYASVSSTLKEKSRMRSGFLISMDFVNYFIF